MIELDISIKGDISGLAQSVEGRIADGFQSVLEAMHERARGLAPVRTGRLRDSIATYISGRLKGGLRYGAPYTKHLHHGTGLYGPSGRMIVIRPRNKKALFWPGAAHPVSIVRQKGIKPMDFVRRVPDPVLVREAFIKGFNKDAG